MGEGAERASFRQRFERAAFPDRGVAFDQIDCRGIHDEKAAVDIAFARAGFFRKMRDAVVLDDGRAETRRRLDCRKRRLEFMLIVESDERTDIDIGDAIAIGEAEWLLAGRDDRARV